MSNEIFKELQEFLYKHGNLKTIDIIRSPTADEFYIRFVLTKEDAIKNNGEIDYFSFTIKGTK